MIYDIDIVGVCNLRCPSCPRGNYSDNNRPKGIMKLELFNEILKKIKAETPEVGVIGLYNWGEPLLHPDLPILLEIAKKKYGIRCNLSSNLNISNDFNAIVRATPSAFRISLSGYYPETYSQTHKTGDIETVKSNMLKLRAAMDKEKINIYVEVLYHIYLHNMGDDFIKTKEFTEKLGFNFHPVWAFLMPVEKQLQYYESNLPEKDMELVNLLVINPNDAKEISLRQYIGEKNKDCQLRANQMAINCDGSVHLCCGVFDNKYQIAHNFLNHSLFELQSVKYRHPMCFQCMNHAIHKNITYAGIEELCSIANKVFQSRREKLYFTSPHPPFIQVSSYTQPSPLVSVGIATYNRAFLLKRAIESVLAQDYPNIEIVISDNDSIDETSDLCKRFCEEDKRIRYIRQPINRGSIINFHEVLQNSQGEFFMWLGDDDWLDSSYISQCLDVLLKNPDHSLVCGKAKYFLENDLLLFEGNKIDLLQDSGRDRVLAYYSQVADNGTIYGVMRKSQLSQIPIQQTMGWDWLFIASIAFIGKIKRLENITINRLHKHPSEFKDAYKRGAASEGFPKFQGEQPHLSTAISAFNEIAWTSPVYSSLSSAERILLAWNVQKILCHRHNVQISDILFMLFVCLDRYRKDKSNQAALTDIDKVRKQLKHFPLSSTEEKLLALYQSDIEDSSAFASQLLPIHFLTIVLNGEPFIRYHIDVFKNLPFKWHWHIVEGVADLKHDTAWSLRLGGHITDELHSNGLSNDGTTKYIDKIAKQYPDNISVYRKTVGNFWDGKLEMVNAPLANIKEDCLLWQIDTDELWTAEQISAARQMFLKHPEKTAAFYWCWFFVGKDKVVSTRNCYSQNPTQEWLRTWRFKPGMAWASHEPPRLCERLSGGEWRDAARVNPFSHEETEKEGLIFHHLPYVLSSQVEFKEKYYGYRDAVQRWRVLQEQTEFPVLLRNYFPWVQDETHVNTIKAVGISSLADRFYSDKIYCIIVDGVMFQIHKSGITRIWESLFKEWAEDGFSKHILVLDRAGTAPKIEGVRYRTIPPYDYNNTDADRQMLQQICDEENATLFISSYYTTPVTTPSIFMAYDMIPEMTGANLASQMWREKHYGIHHASSYMAISENTARDLAKCFPYIPQDAVTVAYCGIEELFKPASSEEIAQFKSRYGISKPYFLLVGDRIGFNGYKNAILFFRAFQMLDNKHEFEIVCVSRAALEPDFAPYVSGTKVHILTLSDDELRNAYSAAIALVYPSKYEGFGLPIAEAMSCGCPVITCKNASIPEVAGNAALYVNENDVDSLLNLLKTVQMPETRKTLSSAGLEQVKKFSWRKMADIVSSTLLSVSEKLSMGKISKEPLYITHLKKNITDCKQNPSEHRGVEHLRQERRRIADVFLNTPKEKIEGLYQTYVGDAYNLLLTSGLQTIPPTMEDQAIVAKIIPSIQNCGIESILTTAYRPLIERNIPLLENERVFISNILSILQNGNYPSHLLQCLLAALLFFQIDIRK